MEYTIQSIAPIFLAPVIAFIINAFFGRKLKSMSNWIAVAAIAFSFVYTLRIFTDFMGVFATDYYIHKTFTWFDLGPTFKLDLGVYLDNMAVIMLLMVTGVATLIHLFSTWYMKGDSREGRFFVFLPLFTSAMIGLVLSDNLLLLFVFWEIMGFCSYSLIGIYYEKEAAGNASLKAFMTTRIGDVIFLLGILALWHIVGSVTYVDIYGAIANGKFEGLTILGFSAAGFAAFTIFCGNIGKSAQFPIHVWLPDAMMGPTPGSALIHAATMVAAGVYLSLRIFPLLEMSGLLPFVAIIGGITAVGAATIALVQDDLKSVLAYSTISQLGYMVLGIGVGSYNAAFMHIITHAIFKACLFMCAGSIIHSIHEQFFNKLGGYKKKLPFTYIASLCCCLAIAGIPFFTGFVSKDRILGDALYNGFMSGNFGLVSIAALFGFIGAFLTPFYMFRWLFLIFHGTPKDQSLYDHCHKEHFSVGQNLPLLILSVFTLGLMFSGSPTGQGWLGHWFGGKTEWFKVLVDAPYSKNINKFTTYERQPLSFEDTREITTLEHAHYHHQSGYYGPNNENEHGIHSAHVWGAIMSIFIAFGGVFLAFLMYFRNSLNPSVFTNRFPRYYKVLQNKYSFDEFYIGVLVQKVLLGLNNVLAFFDMGVYDRIAIDGWAKVNKVIYKASNWFDSVIVDSVAVDGTATSVNVFNLILRIVQTGKIQMYFIVMLVTLVGYVMSLGL